MHDMYVATFRWSLSLSMLSIELFFWKQKLEFVLDLDFTKV